MSNRDVPFCKNEKCQVCGKKGAFDFMGDYVCGECIEEADYQPMFGLLDVIFLSIIGLLVLFIVVFLIVIP